MGWNITTFKGLYEGTSKYLKQAVLKTKLLKAGIHAQDIARARELGVTPEKLLELKQLGKKVQRKTVSFEEMQKLKVDAVEHHKYARGFDPTVHSSLEGGPGIPSNAVRYDLGAYSQTVEDKDGSLVKILSNGMKIRIRKQQDGSRIREVYTCRDSIKIGDTDIPVYSDLKQGKNVTNITKRDINAWGDTRQVLYPDGRRRIYDPCNYRPDIEIQPNGEVIEYWNRGISYYL